MLDDPSPYRDMMLEHLNAARIPWRIAYVASTLSAVRAAVKAGLGVTARPVEMMSPELRVLGNADGLPVMPDTQYLLCRNLQTSNDLAQATFSALESNPNPYRYMASSDEDDDTVLMERDFE